LLEQLVLQEQPVIREPMVLLEQQQPVIQEPMVLLDQPEITEIQEIQDTEEMPDLMEIQEPMVLLEMQGMLVQQEITDTVEQQVIREITEHQEIQEIMEEAALEEQVVTEVAVVMELFHLILTTLEKVHIKIVVRMVIMAPTVMEVLLLRDLIEDMGDMSTIIVGKVQVVLEV
jgi:hypothetical protein